jgi:hypothetical protein
MRLEVTKHFDNSVVFDVHLNGWTTRWDWQGDENDVPQCMIDFILEESLEFYIQFCTIPDDGYYA